jgi:hypothetical protein
MTRTRRNEKVTTWKFARLQTSLLCYIWLHDCKYVPLFPLGLLLARAACLSLHQHSLSHRGIAILLSSHDRPNCDPGAVVNLYYLYEVNTISIQFNSMKVNNLIFSRNFWWPQQKSVNLDSSCSSRNISIWMKNLNTQASAAITKNSSNILYCLLSLNWNFIHFAEIIQIYYSAGFDRPWEQLLQIVVSFTIYSTQQLRLQYVRVQLFIGKCLASSGACDLIILFFSVCIF